MGEQPKEERIFSTAATWLTEKALVQRDRPDFPSRADYTGKRHPLAWKTGTSFGFHDAWTSGWGDKYVTTIWFGNLDYSSSSHLIGSEIAGTVFFDIMEQIEKPFSRKTAPPDLIPIEVCSYSGRIPTAACQNREYSFARMERVGTKRCPNHHLIEINDIGERVTKQCSQGTTTQKSILVHSPEYLRWSKLPSSLPPLAESCEGNSYMKSKILIQSPRESQHILLLNDQESNIPLRADFMDPDALVYWFIDQQFQGKTKAGETLWWKATLGTHVISVETPLGEKDQVSVTVDRF